jgi:hypothetical protein
MKNNKGYYSWIHSLNRAAVDAHVKGKEMLAEQKARKIESGSQKFQNLQQQMQAPKAVEHGKPDIDPAVVRAAAQVLSKEPTTPHSISLAGGDPAEYAKIRREKHAEVLASKKSATNLEPAQIDADGDGDAGDADDVAGHAITFQNTIETGKVPPPPSSWAHGYDSPEDMAAHHAEMENRYEEEEYGRRAGMPDEDKPFRSGMKMESISHKISRMLNEKLD